VINQAFVLHVPINNENEKLIAGVNLQLGLAGSVQYWCNKAMSRTKNS